MKREVMLAKLVFAEELLAGVSGDPGEPIREAVEHVIAVVRALLEENAAAAPASGSGQGSAIAAR
jgi:hypothetical protein